jgi:hypothetical protein
LFGRQAQNQVGFHYAAAHAAVDHECKTSEHFSFREIGAARENRSYPICEV